MIYTLPLQSLKICFGIICYGIFVVIFLHLFRKKIEDILPAFLLALLASFATYLVIYQFDPLVWFNVSKDFYLQIFGEIKGGLVSTISVFIIVAIFGYLPQLITGKLSADDLRSFYHLSYGIIICYFLFLDPEIAFWMLCTSFAAFLSVEYLRESDDRSPFTLFIKDSLNKVMKEQEIRGYMATFFYLVGLMVVVLFLPTNLALGAIIVLVLGDPAAAQVGRKYGGYKWNHNPSKTIEGSMAMFLVGFLALLILKIPLITTIFVALGATLFESLNLNISDNLMIPLICGIIMLSI